MIALYCFAFSILCFALAGVCFAIVLLWRFLDWLRARKPVYITSLEPVTYEQFERPALVPGEVKYVRPWYENLIGGRS